jgi:2-phosphosulfolactate phosphatase
VAIECYVDRLPVLAGSDAAVAVDVLRSATTAITAVDLGRRCFAVATLERATELAAQLEDPLLVGELGGNMPYGFELNNSPAALVGRDDVSRPVILLSTSGTGLMQEIRGFEAGYVACLRNTTATARHLAARHRAVVLFGAATRGEFREEDLICCARIAESLVGDGFEPVRETAAIVEEWSDAPLESFVDGKSGRYLRDTAQEDDLRFVLDHVDDLDAVFRMAGEEVTEADQWVAAGPPVDSDRSGPR